MRVNNHPVLDYGYKTKQKVTFTFEGKKLQGYEGEPIAASLLDNDIKVLKHSHEDGRSRGFFCAIGNCSSCLMEVNGEPNVRVCVRELEEGMVVNRQQGKGELRDE